LILNKCDKVFLLGLLALIIYLTPSFLLHEANAYGNGMCLATCQAKLAARANLENTTTSPIPELIDPDTNKAITTEAYINQAKETIVAKPVYISVILSEVCKLSKKCPTEKYLADTYDNSNRYLSGDFTNSSGEWKRTKPVYPNVFELYKQSNNYLVIFVDPDDYTRQRTKNIFIEPEFYDYFNRGQGDLKIKTVTLGNGTKIIERIMREDFQIDSCRNVRMGWSGNGDKLFSSIIAHLYSGCTRDIGQNNTKVIQTKTVIHNDCGPQCQYLQWMKNATEQAKKGFLVNPNKTITTNEVKEQ